MNKIKVVSVITGLQTGGAEMLLYKSIKLINREKYEPIVVTLIPKEVIATWLEKDGIPVYSLNMKRGIRSLFIGLWKFYQIIKEHSPHIIHAHMFHADLLSRLVGKLNRVPIMIGTIHSEDIGGRNRELLLSLTDRLTNCTIVVCQTVATKLTNMKVINKSKTEVIYNGIDLEEIQLIDSGIEKVFKKEFLIISVGRLHKEKNFPLLIETIADLTEIYPIIRCFIVGDGEEMKHLERLVKKKSLQNHVFLLGRRSDVFQLLASSDLFVLPSSVEGMSVAILEAMAASKPVVATNVGGTAEILQEDTGIIIPHNNKEQLMIAIKKIIEMTEDERIEMGKKARKRIEKEFDLKDMVEKTENLYDKLLFEKGMS